MPSALVVASAAASSRRPAFIISAMRVPSAVTAGRSRSAAYSAARRAFIALVVANDLSIAGDGRTSTAPAAPSTSRSSPSAIVVRRSRTRPTTGTPMARATMVTCAVSEPSSRTTPLRNRRSYSSSSAGPRLRASTIVSPTSPKRAALPSWPETMRIRRFDRSSRVGQPLAQVGIGDRPHSCAGPLLDALDRGFGGQARIDRLVDPPRPALVIGEHLVGFEDIGGLAAGEFGLRHHAVDLLAHPGEGTVDAGALGFGVVGDGVFDDDARLVEHGGAAGEAVDQLEAGQLGRTAGGAAGAGSGDIVDQPGVGDQLGQDHRHGLQHLDLDLGIFAGVGVLDAQHPDRGFAADDRHAGERVEDLLPRLGLVGEVGMGARLGEVERLARRGDDPGQPLAHRQPGDMDGGLRQPLGRVEFEDAVAEQVDRRDLAIELRGDGGDDGVELGLGAARRRHDLVQRTQDRAGRRDRHYPARPPSAASASATSSAMIVATGAISVTMPTDWPAISEPDSMSPSTTARRSAPAQ